MEPRLDSYPNTMSTIDQLHTLQAGQLFFLIALLLVSIFLLAFFSAAEKAFLSFTEWDIAELKKSNEIKDEQLLAVLDKPSSLQVAISLAIAFFFTLYISIAVLLLHSAFYTQLSIGLQVLIFTVVLTIITVKLATFVPSLFAQKHYRVYAQFSLGSIRVLLWLLGPIIPLYFFAFRTLNKLMPISYRISAAEFNRLDDSDLINEENEEEQMILKGIANFGNISVKQIMRNRMDLVAIDLNTSFKEVDQKIKETRYSRLPVYEKNIDTIKGILYAKDLLINKDNADFNWQSLIRPAYFVPEYKKIDDLLKEFRTKHTHIAIVADEYGGTSGIITLEDILEEIVGDISDEYDEADDELRYSKLDDNNYVFDGKTALNDIYRLLDLDEDTFESIRGEADTIGGLVLAIAGRFVFNKEKVTYENFIFTVESADRRRVKRVKLTMIMEDQENA